MFETPQKRKKIDEDRVMVFLTNQVQETRSVSQFVA